MIIPHYTPTQRGIMKRKSENSLNIRSIHFEKANFSPWNTSLGEYSFQPLYHKAAESSRRLRQKELRIDKSQSITPKFQSINLTLWGSDLALWDWSEKFYSQVFTKFISSFYTLFYRQKKKYSSKVSNWYFGAFTWYFGICKSVILSDVIFLNSRRLYGIMMLIT